MIPLKRWKKLYLDQILILFCAFQLKTDLHILTWFKKHTRSSNSHKSKSLTVSTIPSFKANSARASIVIYFVYARSIVYTRVGITFISVWKEPRWEDLFFASFSVLVSIESRCMHYLSKKHNLASELRTNNFCNTRFLLFVCSLLETKEQVAFSNKNGSKIEIESRTDKKDHFFSNGNELCTTDCTFETCKYYSP